MALNRKKILIVDDERNQREIYTLILEDDGYEVTTTQSGEHALKLLREIKVDVVLSDYKMTEMDGITLLKELRKFDLSTEVIIMTAHGSVESTKEALRRGAFDYLEKPIDREQLLAVLERLFSERKTIDAPDEEFIAIALFGDNLKIISLATDGEYRFLDSFQNLHSILYSVSSETIALKEAVQELESLINDKEAQEKDFQEFFERNPNFILNDHYKRAHPHIVLTKDDGETLIPDFMLEPMNQSTLSDLLELKLPSTQAYVLKKRRKRFSSAVFEASAQLREYRRFFDEEKNRKAIHEKYGLLAYQPRLFVIIGRRGNISPVDLRKMEDDLPNIYLRTYDDVLDRMRARLKVYKHKT